jgi:hypothetical protein
MAFEIYEYVWAFWPWHRCKAVHVGAEWSGVETTPYRCDRRKKHQGSHAIQINDTIARFDSIWISR